MRRRRPGTWPAVAAALVLGAVTAPADAARPPQCGAVAVSPSYGTDHTVACYSFFLTDTGADIRIHVSRDGMRTWRQATAAGFTSSNLSNPTQIFFVGKTLFFQVDNQGLLFSDDLGETFRVADPMGGSPTGRDNLTPVPTDVALPLPLSDGLGFPKVEIAYGDNLPDRASVIRPPLHQRVPGSSDADLKFAPYVDAAGKRRWLSISERRPGGMTPDPQIVSVWDCDATLLCTDKRFEFPGMNGAFDIATAPDFARSGVAFATTRSTKQDTNGQADRLWRSADGGRTFTEVAPVAALRRSLGVQGGRLATDIAFTGGRTVVLRMELDDTFATVTPPVRQILVSNDLGATWRVAAYGRSAKQRGPRGTLPWDEMAGSTPHELGRVTAVAGRLFVLAASKGQIRPFCSKDLGRTWATSC